MSITGDRIRIQRLKLGINQEVLAKVLDVKTSTISGYESGYRNLDIDKLKILAHFFDVPYDYLLGDSDSTERENIQISNELGLNDNAINELRELRISANNEENLIDRNMLYAVNYLLSGELRSFFAPVAEYALARRELYYEIQDSMKNGAHTADGMITSELSHAGLIRFQEKDYYEWKMVEAQRRFSVKLADKLYFEMIEKDSARDEGEEVDHPQKSED